MSEVVTVITPVKYFEVGEIVTVNNKKYIVVSHEGRRGLRLYPYRWYHHVFEFVKRCFMKLMGLA